MFQKVFEVMVAFLRELIRSSSHILAPFFKEETIPPNLPKVSRCRGNPLRAITVTFLWPGAGTTTAAGSRSLSPWSSSLPIFSFRSSLSVVACFCHSTIMWDVSLCTGKKKEYGQQIPGLLLGGFNPS